MASTLILSLLLFSLISSSSSLPAETLLKASESLSENGFASMALTLQVVPESLLSQPSSLTIFSPSDSSFSKSGQPSLSLLKFHFLPLYLSPGSLKSLLKGTEIPTILNGRSLIVTSSQSDPQVSLNGVKISMFSLFDDGSLIVFGIDRFFDVEFKVAAAPTRSPAAEFRCGLLIKNNPFGDAIRILRANGYSWMALFLESQIPVYRNGEEFMDMTVFALSDESMAAHVGNFSEYPSLYFRQISPCRILWNDLVDLEESTELPTYMEGHSISVSRSIGTLMIDGVAVFYPDMYFDERIVIHGLRDVFATVEEVDSEVRSTSQEMVTNHINW